MKFIGTALRRASLADDYDTIVIGSGMGGLATAALLAKKGQKVLVLERHYTAGGFTHTYARKSYEWDVGVHYIGEVHRKNSVLRRIFDFVSDGNLHWAQMPDVYDRIYLGEEAFDFVSGTENFRKKMIGYFPKEEKAINTYLQLLRKVNRSSSLFFLERALSPWLAKILYKKLTRDYLQFASRTTAEVLRELTSDQKLISVLTGQWGDYGLEPEKSSFAMHAMVAKHYLNGAAYPVGGSSSIARTIEPVINQAGGQIVTRADVESILVESNRAVGVKLRDGTTIRAKNVVSGAGVINTYQHLLSPAIAADHGLHKKIAQINPSMAHVGVYIGLKGTAEELGISATNFWIYPGRDYSASIKRFMLDQNEEFPIVYISFPSTKDPAWPKKHPGKSTIEIVAPAPYEWFKKWEGTEWKKRGKDYEQLKKNMQTRLLKSLLQKHPQLEGKIDYVELSSPLSTAHFSNYSRGEIYGIDHDPQRFAEKWLRVQTPIKNLFLTGQDIVTCGVGGALCSGVLTAIGILGPIRGLSLIKLMKPSKNVGHQATATLAATQS